MKYVQSPAAREIAQIAVASLWLLIYLVASIATLIKLKFKTELLSGINIGITLGWFISNTVFSLSYIQGSCTLQIWRQVSFLLHEVNTFILKVNLIFYIYEMSNVRQLLKSDTVEGYEKKLVSIRRQRAVILSIFSILFFLYFTTLIFNFFINKGNNQHAQTIFLICVEICFFSLFLYMLFIFNSLFNYFIQRRNLLLRKRKKSFTTNHKSVICWVYLLILIFGLLYVYRLLISILYEVWA